MLRAMTVIALVCLLAVGTGSLGQVDPPRPVLQFRCPGYSVAPTTSIELIGEVLGVKELLGEEWARRVEYDWQVSKGKVIGGQGTPKLVWGSAHDQNVQELNVTLNIKRATPEIPASKSCLVRFDPACTEKKIGEYKTSNVTEEQSVLDAAANQLAVSHDGSVLYIVVYAGRNSCYGEADWRAQRAKKYLSEKHSLNEDRVIHVDGGYRETFSIELIITPELNCGPLPKPTLLSSEVKVEGRCSDKLGGKAK